MTQPSANDVLFGSGVKSIDTSTIGVEAGGVIVGAPEAYQVREYDPTKPGGGAPRFYPSGDPIMAVRVDVQTSQRESATDDGRRRIYIESQRMMGAVRDAVRASGANALEVGARLYVTKTGKERTESGVEANTWSARYVSKAQSVLDGPQQTQQAPQQAQTNPWEPQQQQQYPQAQQQQYGVQGTAQPQWPSDNQQPPPAFAQPQQQQQPQQGGYTPEQIAAARAAGLNLPGM